MRKLLIQIIGYTVSLAVTMSQWNPTDYHQNSSQQRWAQEVLSKLTLRGDEHILDLGCGDGKVTAQMARAVPRGRVVGYANL